MYHGFCTILTKFRLYQGVVLLRSLIEHMRESKNYKLFVLCMDQDTFKILSKLTIETLTLIPLETVENKQLLNIKKGRKLNEYCWTLKPVLQEYVLNHFPHIDRVTFLDGDLCFFNDPEPIFNNQPEPSVLLSSHNYLDHAKNYHEKRAGKTNSGIVSFKRDKTGLDCLHWWNQQCFEWCYDRIEDSKFGDQKHLDKLSTIYSGISYITTAGVNIAPWNESRYEFSRKDNEIYINDSKLIVYHFAGLRILGNNKYALTLSGHQSKIISIIYEPYIQKVNGVISEINNIDENFTGYYIEPSRRTKARYYKFFDGKLKRIAYTSLE